MTRAFVGLEFSSEHDLTEVRRLTESAGKAWVRTSPAGRGRSVYRIVSVGRVDQLSDAGLAIKALRHGTLVADSQYPEAA